jgi:hypothetical protein
MGISALCAWILYIKLNVCLFVCLFVCTLYKFTFLNRSQPNFAHVSPLVWKRPQGTYRPTIFHLPHLFDLFCRERVPDAAQKMAAGGRAIRQSVISVIPERVRVTSRTWRSSRRHLRHLTGGVLHPRQAFPRQRFVRDSGTSSCDVTHTTSWRATVAHSYCAFLAPWVSNVHQQGTRTIHENCGKPHKKIHISHMDNYMSRVLGSGTQQTFTFWLLEGKQGTLYISQHFSDISRIT